MNYYSNDIFNNIQSLYTDFEQGKAAFWRMFDGSLYNDTRRKYNAVGAFMDIYDKVKDKQVFSNRVVG